MKSKKREIKSKGDKGKVGVKNPRKEFKIEIVKVGKLDENTAGRPPECGYDCGGLPSA